MRRRLALLGALAAAGALTSAVVVRASSAAQGYSATATAVGMANASDGHSYPNQYVQASWTLGAGEVVCFFQATSPQAQVDEVPPIAATSASLTLPAAAGSTIRVDLYTGQSTDQVPDPCPTARVQEETLVVGQDWTTTTATTVTVTDTTTTTTTDVQTTTDVTTTTTTDPQTATALDQALVGQTVDMSKRLWNVKSASHGTAHLLAKKKRRSEKRRPRRAVPSKVAAAHVVH